jgi:hypothetical protein
MFYKKEFLTVKKYIEQMLKNLSPSNRVYRKLGTILGHNKQHGKP